MATPSISLQMFFDELVPYSFDSDVSKLIGLCRKFIKNPKKTRIIPLSDCTTVQAAAVRDHYRITSKTKEQHLRFQDKIKCKEILKEKVRLPLYYCPSLKDCKNDVNKVIEQAE